MKKQKKLILIVGPTAIGKTKLSIEIARHFNSSILSVDSRQFYKEMMIGTAKPTNEEMKNIPHYFIDSHSIHDEYTAGKYESDFLELTEKLYKKTDILVAVGGSGLFVKAICDGFDDIPSDITIRNMLMKRLENEGISRLQEELKIVDPVYFKTADIYNTHRIIRALEVFKITNKPISSFQSKKKKERTFDIIKIGLDMDRDKLYERINLRVDQMMKAGLLNETKSLYKHKHLNTLQTVGYQEFWKYFDGEIELEKAVELIKRNTRRFAKRQFTWFKKDHEINWFQADEKEQILKLIDQKI